MMIWVLLLTIGRAHAFDHNYAGWGAFLKTYVEVVNGNRSTVDYKKAQANPQALDQFLGEAEAVGESEYKSWAASRRQAFLINVFNARTIKLVMQKHVPRSLRTLFISVFDEPWFKLFGRTSSLNRIEKDLARGAFKTTLFTFALNHAAKGDPMLRAEPWRAETLGAQYDESVRVFLGDPDRNAYVASSNSLEVSKIFDQHAKDFARDPNAGGSVRAFLTKYMTRQGPPIPADANLKYLPFDSSLNAP